jgi:hypothetical protein
MSNVLHTYGSAFGISASMRSLPGSAVGATGDLVSVTTGGELGIAVAGSTILGVLLETMADVATTFYNAIVQSSFLAIA